MSTFVFVGCHFLAAAYWDRVREHLEGAGHQTRAPELTGWGTRRAELAPTVGLAVHVADIVRALVFDDLREVTLVGHSYGGMVIAGVAARVAVRIRRLIFVDAAVPRHGECLFDHLPGEVALAMRELARQGDGWRLEPPDLVAHGLSAADTRWLAPMLGPVPLETCIEPLAAPGDPAWQLPRTYVWCRGYPLFAATAARLRADAAWTYHELRSGHLPMVTCPRTLAALLAADVAD